MNDPMTFDNADRFRAFVNSSAKDHIPNPGGVYGSRFTFGEWLKQEFPGFLGADSVGLTGEDVLRFLSRSDCASTDMAQLAADFKEAAQTLRTMLHQFQRAEAELALAD